MRGLLRASPAFRSLWLARLLSFLGDTVGLIALLLYTADRFGTGLAVALLMIAADFVPSLLGPLTGVAADRFDKRRVLVACELGQGAIVAVIAATLPSLPLLLALVAVQSCVAAVFQAASRSAVPGLVATADLERANAAIGLGTNGMDSVGPLAGAALLAWLPVRGLLLIDVATFVLSAALLLLLPGLTSQPSRPTTRPQDMLRDAADGVAELWRSTAIRLITLMFCLVVLFNGVDDVALVFLARHTLHAGNSAASLVYAGSGLGLLVGFLVLARAAPRLALPLLLVGGYAVSSLGNLLTGLSVSVVTVLGYQVIRGLGVAAMDVGHTTAIQQVARPDLIGRMFGNVYGAVGAAAGLSYLFGGLLLDATNPRVTFITAGAGGLLAAGLAALVLPRTLRAASRPAAAGRR